MLGADNAGHATHLRPMAAPAEPASLTARSSLGKHSRSEDGTDTATLATAAVPNEAGPDAGAAAVSAPDSDGEDHAPLRTIGDQVAALPKLADPGLGRTTDAHAVSELDAEEAITADSLTVLLSQVRYHVHVDMFP